MRSLNTISDPNNTSSNRPSARRHDENSGSLARTAKGGSRTTLFTPKTPRPLPSRGTQTQTRPPLGFRDRNQQQQNLRQHHGPSLIPMTTRPTITSAAAAKMPAGGDSRSRQPHLSAAAAKGVNRTPITPKVAARTNTGPVVTPVLRRPQNQTTITATTSSTTSSQVSAAPTPRDDVPPTPVSSFLANNITPRSGSRQGRVESTNSTPSATPNPDRNSDGWDSRSGLGLASPALDKLQQHQQQQDGNSNNNNPDSKFFYASDAKSTPQIPAQRQPPGPGPQKAATFFYADGLSTASSKKPTSPPANASTTVFTPVLGTTPEPVASKFFYANGAPDNPPTSRPSLTPSGSGYASSSSSRQPPSRPSTGYSATGSMSVPTTQSRPMSPIKTVSTSSVVLSMRNGALSPGPLANSPIASPPAMTPAPNAAPKRRVSIEVPQREVRAHARTKSIPTLDPVIAPRITTSPRASDTTSPPASPGPSYRAMTMASILQAVEDLGEEEGKEGDPQPEPQSPTKSVHSNDAISELVANARRERKVQDLEITNASLEAINRTLERQLRKQKAELRRYRRLSRTNRISLASAASSRMPSETFTEPPTGFLDMSEEDEETEEDDLESLDDSELSGSDGASGWDPLSPTSKALSRRRRDERRLQLDLSKHQELLIDSQKINQSIKRCLDWTEELIKDGQKALAYNVRVSDVELGGRVLAPPDLDEDEDGPGDASHLDDSRIEEEPATNLGPPPWRKDGQDRDSGIELPADSG